ncbi:antibiotic biosynthesis monooxygenase [Pseudonocardiaceae bacterium YIM PH 21723]|nr:antibiotic biosynthesis monooxygenase [Pseudonocardiaceae bacterium YIM PH 21723]
MHDGSVAIIITQRLNGHDLTGYERMNRRMVELVERQPGYLGRTSGVRADGSELVVIYFADEESLLAWKNLPEHLVAQRLGQERWYAEYEVRIAHVARSYAFTSPDGERSSRKEGSHG